MLENHKSRRCRSCPHHPFIYFFCPVFYLSGKDNPACPSPELGTQKLCGQDKLFKNMLADILFFKSHNKEKKKKQLNCSYAVIQI